VASAHYEKLLEVEIVFVNYCLAFREFFDFCMVRDLVDLIRRHLLEKIYVRKEDRHLLFEGFCVAPGHIVVQLSIDLI